MDIYQSNSVIIGDSNSKSFKPAALTTAHAKNLTV
jgi:hypothetical protein